MINYRLFYPNYSMWDYEFDLAKRELTALTGVEPEPMSGGLQITRSSPLPEDDLLRLAFFHKIEIVKDEVQRELLTFQAIMENSAKIVRNAKRPGDVQHLTKSINVTMNGRKESRYITHGAHDYKGKFYPQLVKSLMTYLGARERSVVFDPFMGCGTTILECYLNNMMGVGVDLNPLAHMISVGKVGCLDLNPQEVVDSTEQLIKRLHRAASRLAPQWGPLFEETKSSWQSISGDKLVSRLHKSAPLSYSDEELRYLLSWFPAIGLIKLFMVLRAIDRVENENLRTLFHVLLSDIIRDCSQQDPRQLRIRRRMKPIDDAPVFDLFEKRLLDVVNRLVSFLWVRKSCGIRRRGTEWEVHFGDSRDLKQLPSRYLAGECQVDLTITSPPYATALPYLDTDRLSLAFFRLADKYRRRDLETDLIGNREITPANRIRLEQEFLKGYDESRLPPDVKECIREVYERNTTADVGFRRKNMGALLYKYFEDMRRSMEEVCRVLKPGARFALIVGNNYTEAGGKRILIETDRYLGLMGESLGMGLVETIPITVTTEDLAHAKNAITENTVIVLEKRTATR